MKKQLISILTFILLSVSSIYCYATGNNSGGFISQIELTDYVIIAGVIIFLIGMVFILLSLFLKSGNEETDILDEEYDEDIEDDIIDDYDNEDYVSSENYIDEPAASEDLAEEVPFFAAEDEQMEADEEAATDEPAETVEETVEEPVEETVEEIIAEEPVSEAAEEAIEEETDESSPEVSEEPIAEEPEALEEENDVIESTDKEPESIRLVLSGKNNPDLIMSNITDFATAGRRSTNDIIISDSAVSGEHCKFTLVDGSIYIEDLNSTNGTFLNGEQVEKAEVKSGDIIILGQKQYRITLS